MYEDCRKQLSERQFNTIIREINNATGAAAASYSNTTIVTAATTAATSATAPTAATLSGPSNSAPTFTTTNRPSIDEPKPENTQNPGSGSLDILKLLNEYKDKGNKHILKNELSQAIKIYTNAILICNQSLHDTIIDIDIKLSFYYNRAQAYYKGQNYDLSESDSHHVYTETKAILSTNNNNNSNKVNLPVSKLLVIERLYTTSAQVYILSLRQQYKQHPDKLNQALAVCEEIRLGLGQMDSAGTGEASPSREKGETAKWLLKESEKIRGLLLQGTMTMKSSTTTNNSNHSKAKTSTAKPALASKVSTTPTTASVASASVDDKLGMTAVKTTRLLPTPTQPPSPSLPSPSPSPTKKGTEASLPSQLPPMPPVSVPPSSSSPLESSFESLVKTDAISSSSPDLMKPKPSPLPSPTLTPEKLTPTSLSLATTPLLRTSLRQTPSPKVKPPTLPTTPPQTVYELERVWRSLKSYPELFAQYLTLFKHNTYKKVIKESISPELITSILICLRDYCDVYNIIHILYGLYTISHFSMWLSLLSSDDINTLYAIFVKLQLYIDESAGLGSIDGLGQEGEVEKREEIKGKISRLRQIYQITA